MVGLGTDMLMPFLLCHVAFLPGGTSGCEAGEQEKAEVPPLKGTAVNFQLKITLGASCALMLMADGGAEWDTDNRHWP